MNTAIPGFDRYWLEVRGASLDTPSEVEAIISLARLEPGSKVFDAGCGPGRIANALAKEGMDVLGVDLSEELIAIAQSDPSGAQYLIGDYLDTPLPADEYRFGQFDAVLSWHTSWGYDHHERNLAFFPRCMSLLRPGGKLVLQTWNPLGMPEQMSNIFRTHDGALICEVLDFNPENLVVSLDRAYWNLEGRAGNRQKAHCQTYTYRDINAWLRGCGFDPVKAVAIPLDHPWQLIVATKEAVQ